MYLRFVAIVAVIFGLAAVAMWFTPMVYIPMAGVIDFGLNRLGFPWQEIPILIMAPIVLTYLLYVVMIALGMLCLFAWGKTIRDAGTDIG